MSRVKYDDPMSLRHALLGLLADRPGSGYDLLKRFEVSLDFVWPATQSQLYTELGKMTDEGLIEVSALGARNRKEYALTDAGRDELTHWLVEVPAEHSRRDEAMLRVFFLWTIDPAAARAFLLQEAAIYRSFHDILVGVGETTAWDQSGFDRCARLALDHGIRMTEAHETWATWAADEFDEPGGSG